MSKKKDEQGHLHRKNYPHAVHIAVAAVTLGMTMGIGVNEVLADQRKNTLLDDARLTTPTVERPGTEFPKVERPEAEFPKVERPGVKFPKVERPGTEFPKVERPEAEFPKVERPGVKFPTSQ